MLPRDFSLVSKASDFQTRNRFDLWTPLALASPPEPWQRGTHPLCVFARLKPGVPMQQAQADLNRVAANLQRLYPADDKERGITAVPLGQHVVANVRTALCTLLAAVGMVLFIACALNIANLHADSRGHTPERNGAGASHWAPARKRLAQQLLTESMVSCHRKWRACVGVGIPRTSDRACGGASFAGRLASSIGDRGGLAGARLHQPDFADHRNYFRPGSFVSIQIGQRE